MVILGVMLGSSTVHAQDTGRIRVSATAGAPSTTFVFTGSGFVPGTQFHELFTDAAQQQYVATSNGQPVVVVADVSGSFQVSVTPTIDLPDPPTRTWLVSFCVIDDASCFAGDSIDITP